MLGFFVILLKYIDLGLVKHSVLALQFVFESDFLDCKRIGVGSAPRPQLYNQLIGFLADSFDEIFVVFENRIGVSVDYLDSLSHEAHEDLDSNR